MPPIEKLDQQFLGLVPLSTDFYTDPYNATRRAKLIVFNSCLTPYKEYQILPYKDKMKQIKNIERACYNYVIDKAYEENIMTSWDVDLFKELYHIICYKISSNLEQGGIVGNPNLAKSILSGTISLEHLPRLSSQEMFPQKYKEIIERVEASKSVVQTVKTSAMYKCSKCRENKCIIAPRYNRSLDEGVNLTITCLNCQHEWNG
jgi:DNA-directed RNA polymerase subunit M/transcription elongation factor TFIIS